MDFSLGTRLPTEMHVNRDPRGQFEVVKLHGPVSLCVSHILMFKTRFYR